MDREERFTKAIEANSRLLYRLVYQILENREDTEDALQDTFLRHYREGIHIEGEEECRAWLIRVASNRAFDRLRSPRRKRRHKESYGQSNHDSLLMEELFSPEPKEHQFLYLYFYEGYKIREIVET